MTEDYPTHGQTEELYVRLLEQISDFAGYYFSESQARHIDFDPKDTSGTTRTHVRVPDELMSWADDRASNKHFRSREMFLGACVAFAAAHPGEFKEYSLELTLSEEELAMIRGEDKSLPNSDNGQTKENSGDDADLSVEDLEAEEGNYPSGGQNVHGDEHGTNRDF